MFPQLAQFTDFGLLALRLMVGVIFISSGWSHLSKAEERSKSIGMSNGFIVFLERQSWQAA
jgi:putative oxidoreductase